MKYTLQVHTYNYYVMVYNERGDLHRWIGVNPLDKDDDFGMEIAYYSYILSIIQ